MGFLKSGGADILGLGGSQGAAAAKEGAQLQAQAGREAIEAENIAREKAGAFFEPFAGVAERGLERSSFLADPQEQFNFLQENPLFKLSLDNANRVTQASAASKGRLSAGDTLERLSNNVLLASEPLIDRQRQDITNLLNLGTGVTESQANIAIGQGANVGNLLTDIGSAQSAGGIGAAQAQQQGNQNLVQIGGALLSAFSDDRLKTNKKKIGVKRGLNWYTWDWNELAVKLGLTGSSEGVMASEVMRVNPSAVIMDKSGFYKVNYGAI